ncbi:unnamed protein product [Microthlaspi erraticum]|uniref:Uncharacterized protein n=1 Tax=Microthlaspi erraticum TaxID=1685480 RepID=A0A6D2I157_9BRAS|nr:unnamed protein product [Microthlaspi erraticum]
MFRARPKCIRPSEVSAKVQNRSADHASRPGKLSPRSATPQPPRHAAHDHAARAGSNASRPRNSSRVPRTNAPSDPGTMPRVRPRFHRPNLNRPTTPADRESSGHDRSDSAQDPTVRPIVPTDRPNAAVDPKPFLKPNPHNSSPKPAPT